MADCRAVVQPLPRVRRVLAAVASGVVVAGACSSGDDAGGGTGSAGAGDGTEALAQDGGAGGLFATGRRTFTLVDPQLRVQGIGRLRVCDASVMPTICSGNTNAPTIMIAERGAELMLGR